MLKKGQLPILLVNTFALLFFSFVFWRKQNYEFLMYIGIILFFLFLILLTNKKVEYPNSLLWGLTLWSILHMSGGGITISHDVLYASIIILLVGAPYNILKYDQVVHIFGFAIATLMMYYLIKPILHDSMKKRVALSIVVVMAGLGVGALNEIVEFVATLIAPSTGVGGYENTMLDLVADLIGAIIAVGYILFKENKEEQ